MLSSRQARASFPRVGSQTQFPRPLCRRPPRVTLSTCCLRLRETRSFAIYSSSDCISPVFPPPRVAAPESCVRQLIETKILTVLSGCSLNEIIIREVLASGRYRKHIERLQHRIAKARALTAGMLRSTGLTVENPAVEGFFLWAQLPTSLDAAQLVVEARSAGILLAPGSMFSLSGRCNNYLRFNVAYGSHPSLTQFLFKRCGFPAQRERSIQSAERKLPGVTESSAM